ncbi:unnamed protein product [Spirodela intermedia]|uniref:protein-serine/threonine phosphatase n=1 Tax=Spirodela intermedia TaxID=51605 RepID=A0A7I8IBE4_SPIIN|nr:unnamed protein product [Spirodela intermedia]CAA6655029.1 unnamed protein product [Spirodela intermedia]
MSPLPRSEARGSGGLPMYGLASSCGRRRDMEDAVSVQPEFLRKAAWAKPVAEACKERMHELVAEELAGLRHPVGAETEWKTVMERSFARTEEELLERCNGAPRSATCRCEMQAPDCLRVGSTAVVAVVTPDRVVVANCGDSRAVLCRNGPERPDELKRIQAAGGQVIYWDCPRVLGVLSMSRAIGDHYLKPYVTSEPEVTAIQRMEEDEFLILASDGLWDVVPNGLACKVARMCLRGTAPPLSPGQAQQKQERDALGVPTGRASKPRCF